jgi:hypothetical protein
LSKLLSFTPEAIIMRAQEKPETAFSDIISEYKSIDRSSLLKLLSLHMPQYSIEENDSPALIRNEAKRLAIRLNRLRNPYINCIPIKRKIQKSLDEMHFSIINEEIAKNLLENFHYLLSSRQESIHFGLRLLPEDKWPVTLVTISPFDLVNLQDALPMINGKYSKAMVLSRAYSFDNAPRNSMSYLLSKVRAWIAANIPEINLLFTYLNPNIGFSGSTYKADNWIMFGNEIDTKYYYLYNDYITDRQICTKFGETPKELSRKFEEYGITESKHKLLPLKIFIRQISNKYERINLHPKIFNRWNVE